MKYAGVLLKVDCIPDDDILCENNQQQSKQIYESVALCPSIKKSIGNNLNHNHHKQPSNIFKRFKYFKLFFIFINNRTNIQIYKKKSTRFCTQLLTI